MNNGLDINTIDNNLERDIKEHRKKQFRMLLIMLSLLCLIFNKAILYNLQFSKAFVRERTTDIIDVSKDPIQKNYTKKVQEEKTFTYHSLINKNKMQIIPQAHYVLSGIPIAENHSFIFVNKFFDSAALYDIGMVWGDIADKKIIKKNFDAYSRKTELTGARVLYIKPKGNNNPYFNNKTKRNYVMTHWSHSHLIPANRNVMAALLKIKLYQKVKIEGELVDMQYFDKNSGHTITYSTSLSRNDNNTWSGDRGNGSCETIYVTKVQIGNSVYY